MPYVIAMAWVPEEPDSEYTPAVCRLPDGTVVCLQMFKAVGERAIWHAVHNITDSAMRNFKMMEADNRFEEGLCSMNGTFARRVPDDK